MKLLTALAPLLLTAHAASLSRFGNDQISLTEDLSIPGENPLVYCESPDSYTLDIKSVDLSPNPPAAGKNLTITASGYLKERVEQGAMVHVEVKYGLIKILQQNIDLCEQASNVNLSCPIEKGEMKLTKEVELPAQIPPVCCCLLFGGGGCD